MCFQKEKFEFWKRWFENKTQQIYIGEISESNDFSLICAHNQ